MGAVLLPCAGGTDVPAQGVRGFSGRDVPEEIRHPCAAPLATSP